jgi:hypothetical protein
VRDEQLFFNSGYLGFARLPATLYSDNAVNFWFKIPGGYIGGYKSEQHYNTSGMRARAIHIRKGSADGRIRTGDPLFTNQDLSRPLRIDMCWRVSFRIRPSRISYR